MSDVILGEKCRENFGLTSKYSPDLDPVYKTYIDTLEKNMITGIYSSDITQCTVTQSMDLISQDISTDGHNNNYDTLVNAIVQFCQVHKVNLVYYTTLTGIVITVNMVLPFSVILIAEP